MNTVCTYPQFFHSYLSMSPYNQKVTNRYCRYDLHGKREKGRVKEKKTKQMKQVRLGSPLHW